MGRRALVTGASGFIGSHLLRQLSAGGWRIGVVARGGAVEGLRREGGVESVYLYAGHTEDVVKAVREFAPDVVFHLASLFLAQHKTEDIEALIEGNVLLGTQLLEAMRVCGAKALVNTGTGWQSYSGSGYDPVNLYAATKQAFEDIARYYVETSGLRCVTLRLFDSYGPGDTRRKLLRVLLDTLRTGEELGMSPGDQVIDLAHVDDICRAFLRAGEMVMEQEGPGARVYAVSGGERKTVREIAALLEEVAGKRLRVRFGARPHREREVMVPWEGEGLPGWRPEVSLREGFRRLVEEEG